MGNSGGHISSGVKAQAAGTSKELYSYVNLGGGGLLVDLMKKANKTKDYSEVDRVIKEELVRFMYNGGDGKWVAIQDLVELRCGRAGPKKSADPLNDVRDMEAMTSDNNAKSGSKYKFICFDLAELGGVGENLVHTCLLNSTSIHADLAKRLLKHYPKLMNDIYISDEYFGENVLHMAIVGEDPALVKYLLDNGADYHQRAVGNFFTADDQKSHRKDLFDQEWFGLPLETNYDGYTYWGEYPLGFAACLGQEECVRLLIAKGADPNIQDTNGNTVLHMLVVHDKKMRERSASAKEQALRLRLPNYTHPEEMFDLLVDLGARLHIVNNQGLTPLTLACYLARKEMYDHILELEREVFWIYGNVTCAAYPLEHIDTISENGEINTKSAMYHIIYGDLLGHLDMIDGVISHLLNEKWKTFAKARFIRRFIGFCVYFLIFVVAFFLRPGTDVHPLEKQENRTDENGNNYTQNITVKDPCYLLRVSTWEDVLRMICEALTVLGAAIYIFLSLKEIYHQGYIIFFQTLKSSPAKALFLMANMFVILTVPGRASCSYIYEDVVSVLAILCTAPYFLFFCRGFKIVGPFVVMIYTMIRTDLLRFFIIYLIFVIGFSQAMYVIYRGVQSNIFNHPVEAMMGMFIMSLGEFGDIYDSFTRTPVTDLAKFIFLVYMVLVTLLLINMLIAMMGNTYNIVSEMQNEWLRQWAKIILVVEQTVTTEERIRKQILYSQPMSDDGGRALVIRWHQSEKEREAIMAMMEEERAKTRQLLAKKLTDTPATGADTNVCSIPSGESNPPLPQSTNQTYHL